ncbi:MAG: mechanosensitive ion channel [Candidatus Sabulitectum sp.]|nr:mechanosensitive ion channel [Candidatus Sabulitectum sp.]
MKEKLMKEFLDSLPGMLSIYGLKILTALAIVLLGRWVAVVIRKTVRKALLKKNVDATIVNFSCSIAYVSLMAFIVIAALGQLGVQTSSFVAILGASALAIGLALQGSLSNLSAGMILMVTRPFKIGDYIEASGDAGVVELISLLATTLKTVDNKKIIIPNSKLIGGSIINYTAEKLRRIDLTVGVSYDSDLRVVRKILMDELTKEERVLKDPAPFVGVVEMADSSVNLVVRPWVNTADYWDVFFSLNESIKLRLDAEGIPIPFPQTDIHLYKAAQ